MPSMTPSQANQVSDSIGRQMRYLLRLRTRLEKSGFENASTFYREVCAAYNALHAANVALHRVQVKMGLGDDATDAPTRT